jgi:fibronectin type 3 domain-containing protein
VPGAPQNLTASTARPRGVTLSWTASASDGGAPITGYQIYRGTAAGGEVPYVSVGVVASYTDTSTKKGVRYYYKIVAVNAVGAGPFSNEANALAR